MTCRYSEVNQHDALYMVARAYPGGIEALAQRMGKTVPVMYNKFRPGITTHHVSFEEMTEAVELCMQASVKDALLPVQSLAWRLGQVLVPVPRVDGAPDADLTRNICKVMSEFGDVASCIHDALKNDNEIKPDDLGRFELEFQEAIAAMFELRARVQARVTPEGDA